MPPSIIRIISFGPVRDIVGSSELTLELEVPCTGGEAFEALALRYPDLQRWKSSVRLAINKAYAPFDQTLQPGDEVSFLPPVSGG
jgi:molybdopterin converting factor small subunit